MHPCNVSINVYTGERVGERGGGGEIEREVLYFTTFLVILFISVC